MNTIFTPKTGLAVLAFLAGAALLLAQPSRTVAEGDSPGGVLAPVGTGFTYQGHLESSGNPVDGNYDFQFMLFDASTAGNQIGSPVTLDNVPVSAGFFNVKLDFGTGVFGGGGRWLQIAVRPGSSSGAYTSLTPRQELTPAPYAQALPNLFTNEGSNFVGIGRNFRISGNEVFGVRFTGNPNQYGGMYVETSAAQGWPFYGYATNGSFRAWTYYNGSTGDWSLYSSGIRLKVPASGGLRIGPALDYSLVISNTTGSDGIRVLDTGDDAIQIGSYPDIANYGVYIPNPGVSNYGLWSNTSNSLHEWALYSVDNIHAGNVVASAYSLVVQVTGSDALFPGDLVAVSGVTEPIPGSAAPIPLVRPADSTTYNGVIGVVKSRMVYDVAPGKEAEGEMSMHSAEGSAQPGDYVSLIVNGIAEVKFQQGIQIAAGERLTASSLAGQARPLQKQVVNGMMVVEGAPVIGVALAAPVNGQDTIPVFVSLR
jgi:hypothetical protein